MTELDILLRSGDTKSIKQAFDTAKSENLELDLAPFKTLYTFLRKYDKVPDGGSDIEIVTRLGQINLLRLSGLKSLPPEIGLLVGLKKLYLEDNDLKELPQEFSNLVGLECLNLSNNELKKISLPPNLKWLDISRNNIREVELPLSLEYLDISCNLLGKIIHSVSRCVSLKYLDMSKNGVKSLPSEFFELVNLEYLNLSFNEISRIPPVISAISNLKYLDVAANTLLKLPSELQGLPLSVINFSRNKGCVLGKDLVGFLTNKKVSLIGKC